MKLSPTLLLVAVILLGAGVAARSQVDVSANLETYRVNRHMPGLMAICIKSGRIVAQGAAGYRRQGQPDKLLLTDRVNLASNTKWMTATIAARLVDRGVISWNTRVCDVFTNYQAYNSALTNTTLDQLLAHRSGVQQDTTFMNNHWNQLIAQNGTLPQLRRWVSDAVLTDPPEVAPGNFLYANQGYTVAAAMLETASGKDWETLMRDEIFTPLRMTSANLGIVYNDTVPPTTPVGHNLDAGQTVPVPRTATSSNVNYFYEASNGAGAYAASTLQDWAKFLHMHATSDLGNFLTPSNGLRLQQAFPGPAFTGADGYSRGAYVFSNLTWALPGNAIYHGGDVWGEDSLMWMAPSRDFIVVAYANCHSADNTAVLALSDAANYLILTYSGAPASGPWLEVPTVLPPRAVTNGYAFDYLSLIGVRYRVESSVDLQTWVTNNGTNGQIATSLQSSFTDTNKANLTFYRVHLLP
jgi:CubicO group peptidase (beta-lactamase class C family)